MKVNGETGEIYNPNACTIRFKAPHVLDEEIANVAKMKFGNDYSGAAREFCTLGLVEWRRRQKEIEQKSKDKKPLTCEEQILLMTWEGYAKENTLRRFKEAVKVRHFDEKRFRSLCLKQGFDADAVIAEARAEMEHSQADAKRVQRDNCGYWLRGVLQTNLVASMRGLVKQGEAWGFSKQQITRTLAEIGAVKSGEGRNTTWHLPK